MRRSIVGLSLAAMLAVAGCASGSGGNGGTGPQGAAPAGDVAGSSPAPTEAVAGAISSVNACELLMPTETGAALGKSTDAGSPPSGGGDSCVWSATDMSFADVEVSVIDLQTFNDTAKPGEVVTLKSAAGLGDGGYYLEAGTEVILNVEKSNLAFTVTILAPGLTVSGAESAERTLAQAILGRI